MCTGPETRDRPHGTECTGRHLQDRTHLCNAIVYLTPPRFSAATNVKIEMDFMSNNLNNRRDR